MKSAKFCVSLLVASSIVATAAFNCLADETSTVKVDASAGDETVSVGNIDVTSGDGADVSASGGYTATLTVDGNVVSNGDDGIEASAYDQGSVTVTVEGDITAPNDDALFVDADNGSAVVTVNGDLIGEDGVFSYGESSGNADVTINGDITVTDDAVIIGSFGGGSASVTVDGDITARYYGIDIYSEDDGSSSSVSVDGDILSNRYGIYLNNDDGGYSSVSVNGNIEADSMTIAMWVENGSTAVIDVTGNVTGNSVVNPAVSIWGYSGDTKSTVVIDGDVNSAQIGVYAYLEQTDYLDMVVTGVISGAQVPITVSNDSEYTDDNFTLTAWKIVPNSDGIIADAREYYVEDYDPANEAVDFEKSINYIVKYDQPSEGGTISAKAADGSALTQYGGYDTARETHSIILSADLEDGYEIAAAYNGEAKTPLSKDDDGNYVLEVERGGGIVLSVDLQRVTSAQTGEGGYSYLVGAVILLAGGCVALTKIRKKEA